FFQTLEFPWTF
nr:immunoglobulin light chain junction region [Macaca mulatta]